MKKKLELVKSTISKLNLGRVLLLFSFISILSFAAPKIANAESGCKTFILNCPDGEQYYVVICDYSDYVVWADLCCGVTVD